MPVPATCPNPTCGTTSSAPAEAVGRAVRCKKCGTRFTVAAPTSDATVLTEPDAPPATTLPGDAPAVIGRFRVRGRIGAGAFGNVYRASDPQLDREVALKVPHSHVLDNPTRVERFLREGKAAASLRHPNVVPVYDAGLDGSQPYIASAFVEGRTLHAALDEGPLDFRRAARIARELAEALAYAHAEGIVHRDVKPDNVLLDRKDHAHLTDFGLAARLDDAARLTQDGSVLGTPAYMAPEVAGGQVGEAKPAADQYAIGAVLYELLTGRPPFEGPAVVVLGAVQSAEPTVPRSLRSDIPRDLETVCLKALAKRPEARYADCQALADDLRRWLDGEPVTARRPGAGERLVRWVRKEPTLAGSLVATAAALIAAVAVTGVSAARLAASADAEHRAKLDADRSADEAKASAARAAEEADKARRAQADAEAAKHDAEAKTAEAEAAKREADAERRKAVDALAAAKTADAKTQAAKDEAAAVLTESRRRDYPTFLAEARAAAAARDFPKALEILDRCVEDQRGWEWRYARAWAVRQERPVDLLPADPAKRDPFVDAAFSADGRRVAVATRGGEVQVLDARLKGDGPRIFARNGALHRVAFSPDGSHLATANGTTGTDNRASGEVAVWDVKSTELVKRFQDKSAAGFFAIAYCGQSLAATYQPEKILTNPPNFVYGLLDPVTLQPSSYMGGAAYSDAECPFNADGTLYAILVGRSASVMSTATRRPVRTFDLPRPATNGPRPATNDWHVRAAFSRDGKTLAVLMTSWLVHVYRIDPPALVGTIDASALRAKAGQPTPTFALSPDGRRVAVAASTAKSLAIYNPTTGNLLWTLDDPATRTSAPRRPTFEPAPSRAHAVRFSDDGAGLLVCWDTLVQSYVPSAE